MITKRDISRGAIWRQWDLHVHTPASFHWSGDRFDVDLSSAKSKKLVDEMIEAMNKAEPAVFAIMDYWTFDGWLALKLPLEMGVLSFVQNVDKELRNGGKASTCGIHAGI